MSGLATSDDRRFCHDVLPRVSRTFAINIRVLRGTFGEAVEVGYLLCRAADAIEDSWPGTPGEIDDRFDLLLAAIAGDDRSAAALAARASVIARDRADLALVGELSKVWRVYVSLPDPARSAVADCVTQMATGMRRFAMRGATRPEGAPYLDDESELHEYCHVVAGVVGIMLTRLFAIEVGAEPATVTERRLALAPVVGEALQLTNILLDWPRDIRRGRCYVPAAWLEEQHLGVRDLVDHDRPEVAALAGRLEALARAALVQVPDYVELIPARHFRYRLFCLWPALWALASLRHARSDPQFPWGARRPRLPKLQLWGHALASTVAAPSLGAVRRMWAGQLAPARAATR